LSNGEFEKSIEDYEEAKKIEELDGSSEFNYRMALAMMKYEGKKYSEALEMLDPDFFDNFLNPMPSILRIHCNLLSQMSRDYSFISSLTEAYKIKTPKLDSEIYYLRALLSYFSNNYEESLDYINKCIFQSDKNLCSIYTLRGFCYIKLKNYSQAFEDFNMAITINGSLENLYAYRGMCAYFAGKNNLAIEDFLYASNSLDYNGFILSIYLLIVAGDIKDAIGLLEIEDGRFGNIGNDKEDQENEERVCSGYENALLKAHCCLLIENYEQCGEILGKFEMTDEIKNDIYMVYNLGKSKVKSKGPGVLFPSKYSIWFQAVDSFYKKNYDGAITLLEQTLDLFQANQIDILFQDNIIIEEEHCEILYNIGLANFMKNTYVKII
jgi:tetratricopeptide (TPR) repeat protein